MTILSERIITDGDPGQKILCVLMASYLFIAGCGGDPFFGEGVNSSPVFLTSSDCQRYSFRVDRAFRPVRERTGKRRGRNHFVLHMECSLIKASFTLGRQVLIISFQLTIPAKQQLLPLPCYHAIDAVNRFALATDSNQF